MSSRIESQVSLCHTLRSLPAVLAFRPLPLGGGDEAAGKEGGVGDREGVCPGSSSSLSLSSPAGSNRSEFNRSCRQCGVNGYVSSNTMPPASRHKTKT